MATHLTTSELRQGSAGFLLRLPFVLNGFSGSYQAQTWRVKIITPDGTIVSRTSGIVFLDNTPMISVPIEDFDLILEGRYFYQVTLLTDGANINSTVESFDIEPSLPEGLPYSIISSAFNYFPIFTTGGALAQSPLFIDGDGDLSFPDGAKFTGHVRVAEQPYNIGWVTNSEVPTKNAVYTKIESLNKDDVGLGNVDNTSDEDKPISTLQQEALDLKANLATATFTGPVYVPDNPYGSGWDSNESVPTKNAIYDRLESGNVASKHLKLLGSYTSGLNPSVIPLGETVYVFGEYNNGVDITEYWSDILILNALATSSGFGNQNQVFFNRADIGMRIYQSASDSLTSSDYLDVVLAENSPTSDYIPKYERIDGGVTVANSDLSNPNVGTTRLHYNGANYFSTTVSSNGSTVFNAVGTSPTISFTLDVIVPDEAFDVGWNGSLEVPTKNSLYDYLGTFVPSTMVLENLADVNFYSTPTEGQILFCNGSEWVNYSGAGFGRSSINWSGAILALGDSLHVGNGTVLVLDDDLGTITSEVHFYVPIHTFDNSWFEDYSAPTKHDVRDAINAKEGTIAGGTTSQYWRGDKTWQTLGTAGLLDTGTSSGNIPVLGAGGKLPTAVLPALAITSTYVVASQAAQLALSAEEGDVAVRTDQNKSYIKNSGTSGTMSDWQELLTPTDTVLSVNGYTGVVVLNKADIGLSNVENTALSTWAGSSSIVTLGTISTGTWQGTVISALKGGTGHAGYSVGDLLYASASSTLSKLAAVAVGNVLISGGVTTAPSWGKVDLGVHVSGNLPVGNLDGGTNASTTTFWRGNGIWANPLTIAKPISSGTASAVLYADGSVNLASSANFGYDGTKLTITATTEQLRLAYDGSNRLTVTALSNGAIEYSAVGSGAKHTFSHTVTAQKFIVASNSQAFTLGSTGQIQVFGNAADSFTDMFEVKSDKTYAAYKITSATNSYALRFMIANGQGFFQAGDYSPSGVNGSLIFGGMNGYDASDVQFNATNAWAKGNFGVGMTSAPSARLHVIHTSEQGRLGYDASNYLSITIGSTGQATFNCTGSGARFVFSDVINIPTATPASSGATGTTGDIVWDANYIYVCTATNTWKRAALATW